jgi:hypothetical protein
VKLSDSTDGSQIGCILTTLDNNCELQLTEGIKKIQHMALVAFQPQRYEIFYSINQAYLPATPVNHFSNNSLVPGQC